MCPVGAAAAVAGARILLLFDHRQTTTKKKKKKTLNTYQAGTGALDRLKKGTPTLRQAIDDRHRPLIKYSILKNDEHLFLAGFLPPNLRLLSHTTK